MVGYGQLRGELDLGVQSGRHRRAQHAFRRGLHARGRHRRVGRQFVRLGFRVFQTLENVADLARAHALLRAGRSLRLGDVGGVAQEIVVQVVVFAGGVGRRLGAHPLSGRGGG